MPYQEDAFAYNDRQRAAQNAWNSGYQDEAQALWNPAPVQRDYRRAAASRSVAPVDPYKQELEAQRLQDYYQRDEQAQVPANLMARYGPAPYQPPGMSRYAGPEGDMLMVGGQEIPNWQQGLGDIGDQDPFEAAQRQYLEPARAAALAAYQRRNGATRPIADYAMTRDPQFVGLPENTREAAFQGAYGVPMKSFMGAQAEGYGNVADYQRAQIKPAKDTGGLNDAQFAAMQRVLQEEADAKAAAGLWHEQLSETESDPALKPTVIPGEKRLWGLLGKKPDQVIPPNSKLLKKVDETRLNARQADESLKSIMAKRQAYEQRYSGTDQRKARAQEALNDPEATPAEKAAAKRILGIP